MAQRFPSVSDLKMADLYLTVNFMYTFATLIEFAVVSYQPHQSSEDKSNKEAKKKKKKQKKNCLKCIFGNTEQDVSIRPNSFINYFLEVGSKYPFG